MKLVAQAPGKLVLLGEYAVLEGAPALALAIDRQASVTLSTDAPTSEGLMLQAPDIGIAAAHADIDARGRLHWRTAGDVAQRLQLVSRIWDALASHAPRPLTGWQLQIDNAGFFAEVAGVAHKLGLGSSAALTVALAAALGAACRPATRPDEAQGGTHGNPAPPELEQLIALHRRWQQAQGSGIDIAASLTGGLICYRQPQAQAPAQVQPLSWPPAQTCWAFIWSGEAVSTTHALRHLAQWRRERPTAYHAHLARLCELARELPRALAGKAADFIGLTAAYTAALVRLADASGLTILTARQARLAQLAAAEGISYKPCGAGGDIGVAVADDPQRLARLRPHLAQLAMQVLPLSIAREGLRVRRIGTTATPARSPIGY